MMQRLQVVSTGISRQSVLLIKGGQEHEEENIKSDDRTGIGTWTDQYLPLPPHSRLA